MNSIAFEARKLLKKQNKNVKGGVELPGGCVATYYRFCMIPQAEVAELLPWHAPQVCCMPF